MLQNKKSNNYVLSKIIAMVLILISGFYIFYSVRAGMAQVIYFQTKKKCSLADSSLQGGSGQEVYSLNQLISKCQKADRLYPYNYRLMAWGAEEAFERSQNSIGVERVDYLDFTGMLCDRGLSLNRYMMPMPFIKMQLLCLKSIKEGTEYWEEYVEWDYWNSYNHAVLAGLYAADGKFGEAMQSLQFIKGTVDFAEANKIVQDYWEADSAMPSNLGSAQ